MSLFSWLILCFIWINGIYELNTEWFDGNQDDLCLGIRTDEITLG